MTHHAPLTFVVTETILKAALIVAAAGLVGYAARKRLPSVGHLIWVLGFAGAIAVPLVSFVVPPNDVLYLPDASALVTTGNGLNGHPLVVQGVGTGARVAPSPDNSANLKNDQEVGQQQKTVIPAWLEILGIVWLTGFIAVLLRSCAGLYSLRVLRRFGTRAFPTDSFSLDFDAVALRAGVTRNWEFRQSSNEALTVPMTWGILRPIVVLPKNSESWPEHRLEAVLLHELAHVRRYDFASQLLADFACALYWFNPIVWLGAHAMRADAELAADDSVLRAGVKASDYAGELLQIAADLSRQRQPFATLGTPAMTNSKIESRVESVLSPSAGRRGITSLQALAAVVASILAIPVLASLHATTLASKSDRSDEEKTEALHRLKYAALGTIMYSNDYDDLFPYVQQTVSAVNVLRPYVKTKTVFESPTTGGKMVFNLNLAGVLTMGKVPSETQSWADTPMWTEVLPDPKMPFAVGFTDGHAKIIKADERDKVLKAAKTQFKRPAYSKPLPMDYLTTLPPENPNNSYVTTPVAKVSGIPTAVGIGGAGSR